jgi:Uri superfamily endonuclease
LKGIYCLLINLEGSVCVRIGKIGTHFFKKGVYIYVGSATGIGSTSLEGRIGRHVKRNKRCYWHIDYFLNTDKALIRYVIFSKAGAILECYMAKCIEKYLEIEYPVKGFGSSDCSCFAHIFRVKRGSEISILNELKKKYQELELDPRIIKL